MVRSNVTLGSQQLLLRNQWLIILSAESADRRRKSD